MNSAPRKGGLDFKIQKPTQLLYEKWPTHLLNAGKLTGNGQDTSFLADSTNISIHMYIYEKRFVSLHNEPVLKDVKNFATKYWHNLGIKICNSLKHFSHWSESTSWYWIWYSGYPCNKLNTKTIFDDLILFKWLT